MNKSFDEAGSVPSISNMPDGAKGEESPLAGEIEGISQPPAPSTGFVYCDVCHDRTHEERQLAAVMEIANVINARIDLDEILSTISRELSKVIDYDIGCLAIYDRCNNGLFMRHVWRKSGDKSGEGRYVPLDEGNLIGWVAIHKKPILRGDIPSDTRFREIMKEDQLKSDIVVPLMANNALVGTVNIGSYTPERFTEFDLDLLVRFSKLTSIAIEKAKVLEELESLGDKYRLLMSNANEIIVFLNASGEVVECNKTLFDLTGYSADEILNRDITAFTTPERRDEAKKQLAGILRGETTTLIDLPYMKKNGEILYFDVSVCVIKIKGHPYILGLAHDVSERKALQEQITLQNNELIAINKKLRELDDLKNEFLGRISHELRTPLSVIMAYTGTLLEDHEHTIDLQTQGEFLRVIDTQSNKLLGLINDLLDLSRVEVSQTMLHKSESSLNNVIRISVKVAESLGTQNRVTIRSDLDETIPIMSFDPLRIRQACVNLLNNAIKFSREGTSVAISSRNGHDEVVVLVQDHGSGIDRDDIPHLFEKFSQLDGGASREKDGLGIGLKLVKHYVELHGGRVWVTSEMGVGSTFYFSLPK